jgi:translation initiation factor 2 subunit 3
MSVCIENTNMENTNIEDLDLNKQPFITIGTQGCVANGKSTLIKALTSKDVMAYKKEIIKKMTIKLGYTNAKFYKCPNCPKPACYQINKEVCEMCGEKNELKLHVSFVDSPGHNELQTTALSGAANMDYCLLVMAADCEQDPETNEHYKAIKYLGLKDRTIGVHNKIDLVTKSRVIQNFELIKKTYDLRYFIPLCAQFSIGINYLIQFIVETIPYPINNKFIEKINSPLKIAIMRSFDVNKPGTPVSELQGAVVGGTIKSGKLRIGDRVKIIPGIIQNDGKNIILEATVVNLKTDNTELTTAYPGGLIGIGLSIDSALSKEDRLISNFIVGIDDTENKIFKTCKIKYDEWSEQFSVKNGDNCVCMIGTIRRNIKITNINKGIKEVTIQSNISMAGQINDSILITKNNQIQLCGKIIDITI